MKLALRHWSRFSVSGLLALTAFAAVGCFWLTWPKRTAERFVIEYFRELDSNTNPFRAGTPEAAAFEQNFQPRKRDLTLASHQRSMLDVLLGRQTFDCESHEFTICRGNVVSGPYYYFESAIRYYR